MLIFRWILLLLLVAGLVSFAMYLGTGQARYKVRRNQRCLAVPLKFDRCLRSMIHDCLLR